MKKVIITKLACLVLSMCAISTVNAADYSSSNIIYVPFDGNYSSTMDDSSNQYSNEALPQPASDASFSDASYSTDSSATDSSSLTGSESQE